MICGCLNGRRVVCLEPCERHLLSNAFEKVDRGTSEHSRGASDIVGVVYSWTMGIKRVEERIDVVVLTVKTTKCLRHH